MKLIEHVHESHVRSRRAHRLAESISDLIPANARVLDVGSGDGEIGALLLSARPDLDYQGLEVLVRPDAAVPTIEFDGREIPLEDNAVDSVMFVDVLHHTENAQELLAEAVRVSRSDVIIKDHLCEGAVSRKLLAFMDAVGNRRHGVAAPGYYWPRQKWERTFSQVGLDVDRWNDHLGLYSWPATVIFDRGLHFLARLRVQNSMKWNR